MPSAHPRPRRGVLLIIATILLLMASGACSAVPALAPLPTLLPTVLPRTEPTPTPGSIEDLDAAGCTVHLWHSFTEEEEAQLLILARDFVTDNPYGIDLCVEFHDPLREELLASMSAGTPPDIIIASRDLVAEHALADAVASLDQYIHSPKHGLSELEQRDLWPVVWEAARLSGSDAEPLGLLFDHHAVVMYLNTDWLEELGFRAPPQNWDEFAEMCDAARDSKAELWGYNFYADGAVLVNWVWGLGGTLIDHHSGQARLDSPETIASLSLLRDFMERDFAICVSEPGASLDSFTARRSLFAFGATDDLAECAEAIGEEFGWSVAPLPHLTDQPVVNVAGSLVSILTTTPQQQLASWIFVKWLSTPRTDLRWALATGALPMHRSVKYSPVMETYFQHIPQYETGGQLLEYAHLEPTVPKWLEVRAVLAEAAEAMCAPSANPEHVLAAAEDAANHLITGR